MMLMEQIWASLTCHGHSLLMGCRGSSGEVLRTGDRSCERTSPRLSGLFHREVVTQTRAYKGRVEQECDHGSDVGL